MPNSLTVLYYSLLSTETTPCCCICCISFCNSRPYSCGVDLYEIRFFPVPENAKKLGDKKKDTVAKISVIILHKLKILSQQHYLCFSGAYRLKSRALAAKRNRPKSSCSCNLSFLKCTDCPLVLFKVL